MNELLKKNPRKMLVHSYINADDLDKLHELINEGKVNCSLSAIVAASVGLGLPLLLKTIDV